MEHYAATLEPAPEAPPSARVAWGLRDVVRGIAVVVAGTLLSFIPVAVLLLVAVGDAADEDDPETLTITIAASGVIQALMLFSAWRFAVKKYNLSWPELGLRWPEKAAFWLPVPLLIASYAVTLVYFTALDAAGVHPDTDLPEAAYENVAPAIAIVVLSMGIAPIVEEVFFRGFVFGGLRRAWGLLGAALASGLLFGIFHTLNPGAFYVVPPIAAVGLIFALGYAYSRSLMGPMIAHFTFNSISFAAALSSTAIYPDLL